MANENGESIGKRARQPLTIGTHSGTFHCDEALACFMLRQLPEYEDARILRSRNNQELSEQCDIVVDVGGEFDHARKLYDHHQNTFQHTLSTLRPELGDEFKIRLSSAGLVYVYYGERIIESILRRHANIKITAQNLQLSYVQIYKKFICEIDAIDNGVPICEGGAEPLYKILTNISARIGKLNPSWEEESNDKILQQRFEKAVAAVGQEFVENVLDVGGSWIKAREYVREALENASTIHASKQILLLPRFCPWKAHLADLEKEYNVEGVPKLIIFKEHETSWRVAGVPVTPNSFLGRKFLPAPWRGLRDTALCETAGLSNLIFVHHTGFIAGATSKDAAIALALKSIEFQEESS